MGGYGLEVNGTGIPLPNSFTFIPGAGSIPVNFNLQSGYDLAELNLQWLIYDFGRRTSLYRTAGLGVDIAQLQTDRAYQTVASEVQTAYYQVLRAASLHRIAEEAVAPQRRFGCRSTISQGRCHCEGGSFAQSSISTSSAQPSMFQEKKTPSQSPRLTWLLV